MTFECSVKDVTSKEGKTYKSLVIYINGFSFPVKPTFNTDNQLFYTCLRHLEDNTK